jgi:hypothetical protein
MLSVSSLVAVGNIRRHILFIYESWLLFHGILVGKPHVRRPNRRHRCRWEDNLDMDLSEVEGDYK